MDEYQNAASGPAEKPEIDDKRKALVKQWCEKATDAREHWKDVRQAVKDAQDFAHYGTDKDWRDTKQYRVPILPRFINQAVSQLYARNPTTVFKRRKRLLHSMWDGKMESLQAAMQGAQMGDAASMELLMEVANANMQNALIDKMGQTLQILYQYYLDEQGANYKQQIKAAVRRAKTSKVAWIKLGYQRMMERRPETAQGIEDTSSKLAEVERTLERVSKDKVQEYEAEMEQLRLNLQDLENDPMLIVREGLVLDFPKAMQVYPDKGCTHLKSLSGTKFMVHEFDMDPDTIQSIYKVDIGTEYTKYAPDGDHSKKDTEKLARVYEIWDKVNKQVLVVCEGYCDFLKEPKSPDIFLERFWPFFPIVFNETEHYEQIYPLSDVEQAKDIQNEYNRSREALRQHRIAALPYWVEGVGLSEEEKSKLATKAAHTIISLPTLTLGQKAEDVLQRGPTAPIDPNLYELESHFTDLMRVIGYQEAQMGGVSGASATETSIAQQSQSASLSDNVDDLDEVLTELARSASQVLLLNVDKQTVVEIVGEGAAWPDTPETREAAAKELYLEVEAGSSGRPNKAADLANMERGMPYIIQLPGINPMPIGKRYLKLLDIDTEEAIADGLPSIQALNAILAKAAANPGGQPTGDPASDPNQQGDSGAQNAPSTQQNEPGPQPGYTAPNAA